MSDMNRLRVLVPKIQFEKETCKWEKYKLSNIVDQIRSYSLSRNVETKKNTGLKYIHYGDIHLGKASYLDTDKYLSFINASSDFNFLKKGDLVLADASEDYLGVAEPCVINFEPEADIVAGLHTIAIRPNKSQDSVFLYYYFKNKAFKKHCYRVGTGMKVFGITFTNLSKFEGYFPKLSEQTQIGNFFQQLDKLIELQSRAVESAETYKKAMLQKMFPQKGEKVPRVRFEGFSEDWERGLLGDLMDVTSVRRIHQADWTEEGVRFLRARDIVAFKNRVEVTEPLYISNERYEEYSKTTGKVEVGHLLVTGVGTIGVSMLIENDNPLYFKDGNVIWFKNNILNGYFFNHSFSGVAIQNFIKVNAGTGTVGTYTIDSGKKTPIKYPSFEEQTAIGNFFQKLDQNIESEKKKLEQYQTMKRAMLQRMFV